MNNYLCLHKALSLDEFLHRLITYLMYKSDLKKGILSTITEFNFQSRLELNKTDNNYFLSFKNIEILKSINGYINVLENPNEIINKIDPIEKNKICSISTNLKHSNLSLLIENQPTNYKEIFNEIENKSSLDYIIPFFDNNMYRFIKSSSIKYEHDVFFKKIDNYNSFTESLFLSETISFLDNTVNNDLFNFISLLYDIKFTKNNKLQYSTNLGEIVNYNIEHNNLNIEIPKTEPSKVITNKVHTFLVPSFNKSCGIAEYHNAQKKGYYEQENTNGIIISINKLENIYEQTKIIHLHHELNFFNGGPLSEDNYLDLEGYINVNNIKFNIYFHTIPKWEVIENSYEGKSILRLINNEKVNTFVFTSGMLKNLHKYPIEKNKLNNIKVLELGLYNINTSLESTNSNKICIIGFNTKAKGNNELVEFLIKNHHMDINIIGRGTEIYQKINNPRLWIISDYLENQQFVNHLKEHANVIICNRNEESTSASASFRLAISLGIPVIASNNISNTSFFENTNENTDGFLFYKKLEEIPSLIEKAQDSDFRQSYEKKCKELVLKYNIGSLTKKLLE